MKQQVEQKVLKLTAVLPSTIAWSTVWYPIPALPFDAVIPMVRWIRPKTWRKIENKFQEIEGNYQFMIHDQSYVLWEITVRRFREPLLLTALFIACPNPLQKCPYSYIFLLPTRFTQLFPIRSILWSTSLNEWCLELHFPLFPLWQYGFCAFFTLRCMMPSFCCISSFWYPYSHPRNAWMQLPKTHSICSIAFFSSSKHLWILISLLFCFATVSMISVSCPDPVNTHRECTAYRYL